MIENILTLVAVIGIGCICVGCVCLALAKLWSTGDD